MARYLEKLAAQHKTRGGSNDSLKSPKNACIGRLRGRGLWLIYLCHDNKQDVRQVYHIYKAKHGGAVQTRCCHTSKRVLQIKVPQVNTPVALNAMAKIKGGNGQSRRGRKWAHRMHVWWQGHHQAGIIRGETIPADSSLNIELLLQGGLAIGMINVLTLNM